MSLALISRNQHFTAHLCVWNGPQTLSPDLILCSDTGFFLKNILVSSGSDVFQLPMHGIFCASLRRMHVSRQRGQHSSKPKHSNQLFGRDAIYWELSMCSTHGVFCTDKLAAWLWWGFSDTCQTPGTLVKHWGHLSNTGDRASFYVKIITEGHCKKMFCKERRDRNSLAEKKTEGFAKGFFLAGGHGKRTEISFSDKLDALGERECLCQRWWNCCVREKQAPSSANPSCLFCGRVVGGAQVALGF